MARRGKTSGIHTDAAGNKTVDKQCDGVRIFARLGSVAQQAAEAWLAKKIDAIRHSKEGGRRPRVDFEEAAARYLREGIGKLKSIDVSAYHVELLLPWIGKRPLNEVHDHTLEPFVKHRLEIDRVSLTTVNRSLEVARRILNLAARKWRHENGVTWLESAPLITVDSQTARRAARKPYPLSWEEFDLLYECLPPHLQEIAMFKVNTGTREKEVCRLRWEWEVKVPEIGGSVFIVPGELVKNGEDRLIVLNRFAQKVIEARRGIHPERVFTWKREWRADKHVGEIDTRIGEPVMSLNNTAWQAARETAAAKYPERFGREAPEGFTNVRVHDLKHTFGRRLRAAGVGEETRKVLLGHTNRSITTHYSGVELQELVDAANKIDRSKGGTMLRVVRELTQKSREAA